MISPHKLCSSLAALSLLLSACASPAVSPAATQPAPTQTVGVPPPSATPLPTREAFSPGELVEYSVQTGDTLPALAARFNTSIEEIMAANPVIPQQVTTLPPGMPMQIPIYYRSFWGSPFQIIPDSFFINGPLAVSFDTSAFVAQQPGWFKDYVEYAAGKNRTGAEIVDYVAQNFSINPMVLLALLDYQAGALSNPILNDNKRDYPLGYEKATHRGVYLQLVWAANQLNDGYYLWRAGDLVEFDLSNNTTERPDPWQNAATVSFQLYFNTLFSVNEYRAATGPEGIARTFTRLYGDLWALDDAHIPGSLTQPGFILPFEPGKAWAYTGGPHTGWGSAAPYAALDFAPPSETQGCFRSDQWATAVADGLVVRSETGIVVLDLDEDGDERTGWVVFYLHLETRDRAPVGALLKQGDPIGHPGCEGGTSTGSHVHIARKFNGEWILADSALAFNLEGWTPIAGAEAYQGELVRGGQTVTACTCSTQETWVISSGNPNGQ